MKSNNNSFREKPTKYVTYMNSNKNIISTTLDNKHQDKINEFDNNSNILLKNKKKLKNLNNKLEELNNIKSNELNSDIINLKTNIKTDIEDLVYEITQLESRYSELDYYDNTIDILLEYYNSNDKNKPHNETNIININDVFKKKELNILNTDKSKLYEKYMKKVYNVNTKKTKNTHISKFCIKCKIEKTIHVNDGYVICTSCGDSEPILLENDKPNFKDSNIDSKNCAYKRGNHLSEILNQFQAKESTEIDKDIYDKIKEELKIQRIYDYKSLDHKSMKKILKKLKLNKYYEHTHHIINNLNGMPPPTMTREQEETIKKCLKKFKNHFQSIVQKKERIF